jgi:hypothetical protein
MTRMQRFLFRLHELFGSHHFELKRRRAGSGYNARCSCGAYLKRTTT